MTKCFILNCYKLTVFRLTCCNFGSLVISTALCVLKWCYVIFAIVWLYSLSMLICATAKFLLQHNNCTCVDASLSYFSLEKTFNRKSVQVDFLLRGVHSDPQHSALGCRVCWNLLFVMLWNVLCRVVIECLAAVCGLWIQICILCMYLINVTVCDWRFRALIWRMWSQKQKLESLNLKTRTVISKKV